jgi:2',3'-cyclic-nucleotide 2'-phosphodiesterase/3'-nucleotidase
MAPAATPSDVPPAAESVDIVIAGTTDTHGRLRAWDYYRNVPEQSLGLTRLATVVDSIRAANPGRVLLLDAGDILQGNPMAEFVARDSMRQPNAIIAAMNAMRYDAAAIGNHEYNFGVPYLDSAIAQARFPFLSDNTYRPDKSHAFAPWKIFRVQGVRVAVIGATTPGVALWDAEHVRGRLTFGDIVPAVRQSVGEVRKAGSDLVVLSVHSGLDEPSSYDTVSTGVASENVAARVANEVPGIDVILYGHSHKEVREKVIGSTLLVQPKNWATSLSVVHVILARESGRWRVARKSADLIQAANHPESPAVLAATEATHQRTVAYFNAPIGTTRVAWRADSARLRDTPIIDFILETEMREAKSDLASAAAFDTSAILGPGPVTAAQVAHLYPYANTLKAIRISGAQLRQYLDFSSRYYTGRLTQSGALETNRDVPGYNFDIVAGVDYTIDLTRPLGGRITRLIFHGQPVKDSDSFTLALSNYRQTGGGGFAMLSGAPITYDRQTEIPQLLMDEARRRGELRPQDFFILNWNIVLPASSAH